MIQTIKKFFQDHMAFAGWCLAFVISIVVAIILIAVTDMSFGWGMTSWLIGVIIGTWSYIKDSAD